MTRKTVATATVGQLHLTVVRVDPGNGRAWWEIVTHTPDGARTEQFATQRAALERFHKAAGRNT